MANYADVEKVLELQKGYAIRFYHVPSGKTVSFKALIQDFDDKYTSQWEERPVYGRNDKILNYTCTSREISFSFDVVAASLDEAKENLAKASLLLSFLYPAYASSVNNAATIAAAPLVKLSFVNLIQSVGSNSTIEVPTSAKSLEDSVLSSVDLLTSALSNKTSGANSVNGLVGKLGGLSYKPQFVDGFFDLVGILYPQSITFAVNFTVLHTHSLGFSESGVPRQGFRNFPYGVSQVTSTSTKTSAGNSASRQINSAKQKAMEK